MGRSKPRGLWREEFLFSLCQLNEKRHAAVPRNEFSSVRLFSRWWYRDPCGPVHVGKLCKESTAVDSSVRAGWQTSYIKLRGQTLYNISDLVVCRSHALCWFGCKLFPPFSWSSTKGSHAKTEFSGCVIAFVRQNCLAWMERRYNQGCHKLMESPSLGSISDLLEK